MAGQPYFAACLIAAALAGCAELAADAPLFAADGPNGPPPLTEGVWIAVSAECPDYNARRTGRFPKACTPLDIRRETDGGWLVRVRVDLVYDLTPAERIEAQDDAIPYRVVIAPAVEREVADSYAPLYIAEARRTDATEPDVGYAVVAPVGPMPATTAYILGSIGCADILRDGPIIGIMPHYTTRPSEQTAAPGPQRIAPPGSDASGESDLVLSGCTASSQAAVREAARRAVVENIDEMQQRRYVFVRTQ